MCGICGYFGKPEDGAQEDLFKLLTALMLETQSRGRHATGWAGMNMTGTIVIDKAPITASQYVVTNPWLHFARRVPPFFLGHCRNATDGHPSNNENNHPFISDDGGYALIHNGVIRGHKKIAVTEKFNLKGECDSEVLLHVIESKRNPTEAITKIFRNVFSYLQRDGACAVLDSKRRKAYLFRNQLRPCFMIRLPEFGNAVFFASTRGIFQRAYSRVFNGRKMPDGFDLKPARIYTIDFVGDSVAPVIDTHDVDIPILTTGHFFSDQLPAPGRRPRRRRQAGLWPIGFDEIPDYGPEEVECECGNIGWIWHGETKVCSYCGDFELTPGSLPKRIASEDDDFLRLHCKHCEQVWEQRRILDAKCIKCDGTWIEVIGIRSKKHPDEDHVSVWTCMRCGIQMITHRSPVQCARCGHGLFRHEGEVRNGILPKVKRRKSPRKIDGLKSCHDCPRMIPVKGPTRCQSCVEKRRKHRRRKKRDG